MKLFQTLKDNDIKFVVTMLPEFLDTRSKNNNPATALISDIVLAVFNWQAQSEHDTTMERCTVGRKEAKKRGVVFGRKSMSFNQLPKEFIKTLEDPKNPKDITVQKLVYLINGELNKSGKQPISRATFYNYKKIYDEYKESEV